MATESEEQPQTQSKTNDTDLLKALYKYVETLHAEQKTVRGKLHKLKKQVNQQPKPEPKKVKPQKKKAEKPPVSHPLSKQAPVQAPAPVVSRSMFDY